MKRFSHLSIMEKKTEINTFSRDFQTFFHIIIMETCGISWPKPDSSANEQRILSAVHEKSRVDREKKQVFQMVYENDFREFSKETCRNKTKQTGTTFPLLCAFGQNV